jgi:hypothetical protein
MKEGWPFTHQEVCIKGQAGQAAATPWVRVLPQTSVVTIWLCIMPEVLIPYRKFDSTTVTRMPGHYGSLAGVTGDRVATLNRVTRICKTADRPRAWLTWVFTLHSYEILIALTIRPSGVGATNRQATRRPKALQCF